MDMIFESLHDSARLGELLLIDGGYCRWHKRRDNTITIYEIMVLPTLQRNGIGTAMLQELIAEKPIAIRATCPADLPSNDWYKRHGFHLVKTDTTKSGRTLNLWRLDLEDDSE